MKCFNNECPCYDHKQRSNCNIKFNVAGCEDYKPLTTQKESVADVACNDGLATPTLVESVEIWSDMIAEAKDRDDIGDLSSIAHRLILIACTGGFKAH